VDEKWQCCVWYDIAWALNVQLLVTDDGPGNGKGEVILFEPPTSEHISARTIFDPITALAPATDCRTYAIGYLEHRD
jgi:hypothetical protein